MKVQSTLLRVGPILFGTLVASACGGPKATSPADLASILKDDTGVEWGVLVDPRTHEVSYLLPTSPVEASDDSPEPALRAFFERYGAALHGTGAADELRQFEAVKDSAGVVHVTFRHFVPGTDIPVFDHKSGAMLKDRRIVSVMPGFRADIKDVAHEARINKDEAVRLAQTRLRTACNAEAETPAVEGATLGVRALANEPAALVWRLRFDGIGVCRAPEVDVNAITREPFPLYERAPTFTDMGTGFRGRVLAQADDVHALDVTPLKTAPNLVEGYVMRTEGTPVVETMLWTPGDAKSKIEPGLIPSARTMSQVWDPNGTSSGAAVDAHRYTRLALDYFRSAHRRNSVDDKDKALRVVAHDASSENSFGQNAYWSNDELHFGDGNHATGGNQLPFSTSFDVVAHELAHGVTEYTSNLRYERESGALNESFSDVMGVSAVHWLNPSRSDFIVGADMMRDGAGLRDMAHPERQNDPTHYAQLKKCRDDETADSDNDSCHVHKNSGIPNKAFSLMVTGGVLANPAKSSNPDAETTTVKPIGWDVAADLWFRSVTTLSNPDATFNETAWHQLAVAFVSRTSALSSVTCAWSAVGVLDIQSVPLVKGIVCPPAPKDAPAPSRTGDATILCKGRKSGYVCNARQASMAFQCENEVLVGAAYCDKSRQKCKQAAPDDPTATVSSSGALNCE
jgi:Zn-dependent metalloprotease